MAPTATSEPANQIWLELAVNTAGYLGAIAYGLNITVYSIASYYILTSPRPRRWKLHIFNTVIFALGTIHIATTVRFDQDAWVLERNYPGGPYAFFSHEQSRPVALLGLCAAVVADFLLIGLLLWRTYVVWGAWYIVILPVLLFISTMVLTVTNIVQSTHPYLGTWGPNLGLACWSMSTSLNILLTVLIAARLLYHRRKLLAAGIDSTASSYTGTITLLIETTFPVALIYGIFIILYAKQNAAENLLLPFLCQITCIAPQLILIRVHRGRAWSRNTANVGRVIPPKLNLGPTLEVSRSLGSSCTKFITSQCAPSFEPQPSAEELTLGDGRMERGDGL